MGNIVTLLTTKNISKRMIVGRTHKKILTALNEQPRTMEELMKATGYSRDGLRGRISELRKMGYEIDFSMPTEREYSLVLKPKDKILLWMKEKKSYGKTINIDVMSRELKIPRDVIEVALSEMFLTHNVTQLSNNSFIIK